jgi:hypothetical protein
MVVLSTLVVFVSGVVLLFASSDVASLRSERDRLALLDPQFFGQADGVFEIAALERAIQLVRWPPGS